MFENVSPEVLAEGRKYLMSGSVGGGLPIIIDHGNAHSWCVILFHPFLQGLWIGKLCRARYKYTVQQGEFNLAFCKIENTLFCHTIFNTMNTLLDFFLGSLLNTRKSN